MDPAERIVDLALFIAGSPEPVTAEQCRGVEGYPSDQDEDTFKRMFERDKDELRAAGLVIEVDRSGPVERYFFDADATFVAPLTFTAEEGVLLRAAGASSIADPAFPYRDDLRFALGKLLPDPGGRQVLPVRALTADESPEEQADAVARLTAAATDRKLTRFTYTNLRGVTAAREVEPYGLFARDGRWYLVGHDCGAGAIRVFAIARVGGLSVEKAKPRSPDFERPADFDVASWMLLPFQFGSDAGEAVLRFSGPAAARAEGLVSGRGELAPARDGAFEWSVRVADESLLATWAVEHGPGIEVVSPASIGEHVREGLQRVAIEHGG